MPHRLKYDEKRQVILCRLEGQVEGEEVAALIDDAIQLSEGRGATCNACWDCRRIRSLAVSPTELSRIVTRMNQFASNHPEGRTAIVTARLMDQVMAQLLVLKSYGSARDRKSFIDLDEALEWVGATDEASAVE